MLEQEHISELSSTRMHGRQENNPAVMMLICITLLEHAEFYMLNHRVAFCDMSFVFILEQFKLKYVPRHFFPNSPRRFPNNVNKNDILHITVQG